MTLSDFAPVCCSSVVKGGCWACLLQISSSKKGRRRRDRQRKEKAHADSLVSLLLCLIIQPHTRVETTTEYEESKQWTAASSRGASLRSNPVQTDTCATSRGCNGGNLDAGIAANTNWDQVQTTSSSNQICFGKSFSCYSSPAIPRYP